MQQNTFRKGRRARVVNKTIRAMARQRFPSGTWVIALAKVVHLSKYLLWSTIIALSLFGLSLLVALAAGGTWKKKILKSSTDEQPPRARIITEEVLPPLD